MRRLLAVLPLVLMPVAALAQNAPVPVNPRACLVTTVTTGGTAVTAYSGPVNGFLLKNPIAATENLEVNFVGTATTTESGTTYALPAGGTLSFTTMLGASFSLSVNAATSAHAFVCSVW